MCSDLLHPVMVSDRHICIFKSYASVSCSLRCNLYFVLTRSASYSNNYHDLRPRSGVGGHPLKAIQQLFLLSKRTSFIAKHASLCCLTEVTGRNGYVSHSMPRLRELVGANNRRAAC